MRFVRSRYQRVFTFNGRSQDSTAIDATNGAVLGTIKLEGSLSRSQRWQRRDLRQHRDRVNSDAIDPRSLK